MNKEEHTLNFAFQVEICGRGVSETQRSNKRGGSKSKVSESLKFIGEINEIIYWKKIISSNMAESLQPSDHNCKHFNHLSETLGAKIFIVVNTGCGGAGSKGNIQPHWFTFLLKILIYKYSYQNYHSYTING